MQYIQFHHCYLTLYISVTSHSTQVCFAYYIYNAPSLWARVHYYAGDERVGTDINFDLRTCPEWPMSFNGEWGHTCINLQSCLIARYEDGQMFQVDKIWFSGGSFLIDEFSVSPGNAEGLSCIA